MHKSKKHKPNLIDESDRGIFIVAAACIEAEIDEILISEIRQQGVTRGFEKNLFDLSGPLSSLSSKSAIAYAFGLISKESYQDISLVRKLRNQMAHSYNEADIQDDVVQSRIKAMSCVKSATASFKSIKRFNYVGSEPKGNETDEVSAENGLPEKKNQEYHARLRGFVNYYKAVFSIGIQDLLFNIKMDYASKQSGINMMDIFRRSLTYNIIDLLKKILNKRLTESDINQLY